MTISRLDAGTTISRSVTYQGIVYVSGMTAEDKSLDMAGQTSQILDRIARQLSSAGTDKSRLLTATVYLSDISQKEAMNQVWQRWIEPGHPPARVTVGAELGSPTTLVEISVTAAAG
jgi:enamine deaminase RidA (YjgF/YER057c/UK114 family)